MYYNKINRFIENLNKDNILENKSQLKRYIAELILSIKDFDNSIDIKDLEEMLSIKLFKEEMQTEIERDLEEDGGVLGALTNEFIKIYKEFTYRIVEKGYIEDAIGLTRMVLKALDYNFIEIYLLKKNNAFKEENSRYINSINYLNDLQEYLEKYLNKDISNISKECFNVLGLIDFIKNGLEEDVSKLSNIFLNELRNKSLNEFNKENHIEEYKNIFTPKYVEELNRRRYEWDSLSYKLKENYYKENIKT